MVKTKIKKAIAIASLVAISATNIGADTYAAVIGTTVVTGGATTNVIWDDTFPGTAVGSGWVVVNAYVSPALSMTVSSGSIELGTLAPTVPSSNTVGIEVGTNAVGWVAIQASSWNWGLTHDTDGSMKINNLVADGLAESYTFTSTAWADDSDYTDFALGANFAEAEINDSSQKTIYSTNRPEKTDAVADDVVFTVEATIDEQTPGGNYTDNITLTVTGTY